MSDVCDMTTEEIIVALGKSILDHYFRLVYPETPITMARRLNSDYNNKKKGNPLGTELTLVKETAISLGEHKIAEEIPLREKCNSKYELLLDDILESKRKEKTKDLEVIGGEMLDINTIEDMLSSENYEKTLNNASKDEIILDRVYCFLQRVGNLYARALYNAVNTCNKNDIEKIHDEMLDEEKRLSPIAHLIEKCVLFVKKCNITKRVIRVPSDRPEKRRRKQENPKQREDRVKISYTKDEISALRSFVDSNKLPLGIYKKLKYSFKRHLQNLKTDEVGPVALDILNKVDDPANTIESPSKHQQKILFISKKMSDVDSLYSANEIKFILKLLSVCSR